MSTAGGDASSMRWAAVAVGLAALGPIVDAWALVAGGVPQIDDAFISYRYAANLVDGHGLVWNPGERVEGFTNPLWTGLVALALALGFEATATGAALGLASAAALLFCTAALAWWLLGPADGWLAPLAVMPLAASSAFVFWSTSGLETALGAALACGVLLAHAAGRRTATVGLLVALTYTRMDGALLAAVLLAHDLGPRWRDPRAWSAGAVYAAALGLGALARFAYYGAWLPNTYWANVGGTPAALGLDYVALFVAGGPGLLLPAAIYAVVRIPAARPAAIWIGLHTAYVVRVGGDAFAFDRFMLVVLGPLCALAVAGLVRLAHERPWAAWALAPTYAAAFALALTGTLPTAFVALFGLPWLAMAWRLSARPAPPWALRGGIAAVALGCIAAVVIAGGPSGVARARGESARNVALAKEWQWAAYMIGLQKRRSTLLLEAGPPRLVASGAIGSLGFYSRLPILDVLGLTDPHIARAVVDDEGRGLPMPGHARSDADYVFAQAPDVIVIPKAGEGPVWVYAMQDLWAHPELARSYAWDDELVAYRRIEPGTR